MPALISSASSPALLSSQLIALSRQFPSLSTGMRVTACTEKDRAFTSAGDTPESARHPFVVSHTALQKSSGRCSTCSGSGLSRGYVLLQDAASSPSFLKSTALTPLVPKS